MPRIIALLVLLIITPMTTGCAPALYLLIQGANGEGPAAKMFNKTPAPTQQHPPMEWREGEQK